MTATLHVLSNRSLAAVAVLAAAFTPAGVAAQQAADIPADVETVVTGGQWTSGKLEGTYRVIVRTGGFEHLVSVVQVDWIQSETENEPARVLGSKIADTGSWRMSRPRIVKGRGHWRVLLDGIETHSSTPALGRWQIDIGEPGVLKVTSGRK